MSDNPVTKEEAYRVAREEAYRVAKAMAMQQFDEIEPKLKDLQAQIVYLRWAIKSLSHLLKEDVPYDYSFDKVRAEARDNTEMMKKNKERTKDRVFVTGSVYPPPLPKPNQEVKG